MAARGPALLLIAAAALVATPFAAARQGGAPQTPTFRAGTRTVPIYATVTDELGQFVLDMKQDEFEVRDEGRVQPLTVFETGVQPLTAFVLMDGSRSMAKALQTVITAADHFVVRLMPGDRARVGSFSEQIRFGPAFTGNRDALAREVNDLFDLRVGFTTRLWDAIAQAADQFEGAEGRRVIVVFTDGDDTASDLTSEDALSKARRADAMIYAVLIRGMDRLPEDRVSRRRARPEEFADVAFGTGGGYYLVNNVLDDMNAIATEVAEELHSQYMLGFTPRDLDGKLHKLDVRVKRPHVKVRARQSYIAEAAGSR